MKALHPLALGAAALLVFAEQADAGDRSIGFGRGVSAARPISTGHRINIPRHSNHFSWEGRRGFHGGKKFHGGFGAVGGVWVVEREVPVIIEREVVVREVPAEPPPPPPEPRKPHVIGASYSSLPGGCMKLIDEGVSYYGCGGEWYRQVGGKYVAVAARM